MPKSCCQVENVEFRRAGHAGALRPHDAVAASHVPRSWGIQKRRPCEVAKLRSMDLRDKRHSDHLLGAACKQPRANYGWFGPGIHTSLPSLQLPSVERSEAPQAPAHAIERTWATKGAGKRAPSSSRSARFVPKSGRSEEDVFGGGRIGFTCARKSSVSESIFWRQPQKLSGGLEI